MLQALHDMEYCVLLELERRGSECPLALSRNARAPPRREDCPGERTVEDRCR